MLGRQSEAEHSLSFEERNAIIFRLKQFLTAFLIEKNISFIVFRSIPHFAAEYILQEVARKLGVLCVSKEDIDPISKSFLVDLHNRKFTGKLYSPSPCDETATIEVRRLFDLFLENHTNKKLLHPNYFIKNANSAQTARKPFTLVVRILKDIFLVFIRLNALKYASIISKKANRTSFNHGVSEFRWRVAQWKARWGQLETSRLIEK